MGRKGPQLLCRLDQPPQHRVGGYLDHPCGAPDAQAPGHTGEHPYEQLRGHALAVEERAKSLQKGAATDDAQQLAPAPPVGMAVGTEIAPARPAPVPAIRMRAELGGRVDLAAAPSRRLKTRGRSCGGLRAGGRRVRTGVTVRLVDEARKRCGRRRALSQWGYGLRRWACDGVAGPCPLEQEAQPHQGDQHQLIEKEIGNHGKTPSYKC
jgi:hypothetical protein